LVYQKTVIYCLLSINKRCIKQSVYLESNMIFPKNSPPKLGPHSKIGIIGGGPAGAFFAIDLLRTAKKRNLNQYVTIIEKKKQIQSGAGFKPMVCREGCNYCVGGISPKLLDIMEKENLKLPQEIIEGQVESFFIQGDWKHIELRVPKDRKVILVFRGSKPRSRHNRYLNFDSFLLDQAMKEGATLISGEVTDAQYNQNNKPSVQIEQLSQDGNNIINQEFDFLVFAGGVNQSWDSNIKNNSLVNTFQKLSPNFKPPKVRKTLIFELLMREQSVPFMAGEIYFVEYGSKSLKVEMSSIVPKGKIVTVALLGSCIDNSKNGQNQDIVERYINLPHVRRNLPPKLKLKPVCFCNPKMSVGLAKNFIGNRVAVIGDMVVSKLYKDGIYAAYSTAHSLAKTIHNFGIDEKNLKKNYIPIVNQIARDNFFGKFVFLLNRIVFSRHMLSRIVYQAVLTERKKKPESDRRIAKILWNIAAGDNTYLNCLLSMLHPITLWRALVGGAFVTFRNYLTEVLFGLDWKGFGRFPTGMHREDFVAKRLEFNKYFNLDRLNIDRDFERMYSIKIKATHRKILGLLGKFGDPDMAYFKQRFAKVSRINGEPNQVGTVIQYRLSLKSLNFRLRLESFSQNRYIVYRVIDGFPKGGILVFDIEKCKNNIYLLYIYVSFNFPHSEKVFRNLFLKIFRYFFPDFSHDVLWNHTLCKIKDIAENEDMLNQTV
jgi:flavin-dependent dehydrogenase